MKGGATSGQEIKEKRRAGAPIQGTGTSKVERSGGTHMTNLYQIVRGFSLLTSM
jgi:hypothetical protein